MNNKLPKITFIYNRYKTATPTTPAAVEMRITYDYKQKYISTGIMLLPHQWKKGIITNVPDAVQLSQTLDKMLTDVRQVLFDMMNEGHVDIFSIPDRLAKKNQKQITFLEFCDQRALVRKYGKKQDSKERYDRFMRLFTQWGKIRDFNDINEENIISYDKYLADTGMKANSKNNINDQNGYYGNYDTVTPTQDGNNLSASLSYLQPNTTYYFCVVAYVDGYYICGDVKSFTTKAGADYIKTEAASDITMTSATLKGSTTLSTIYPSTTSIQYSVRYATSSSYLTSNYNSSSITVTKNGNTLSGTATNLKSETTYYYCVVAYVEGNYFYGETKNFTTKSGAEYLKTGDASNITMTSATVKGTTTLASVYNDGSTIQYRILYGTSSNPQNSSSSTATPKLNGTTLTAELTNLTMATTYYYCVRASINGSYVYSDTKSFTTKDIQTTGSVDLGVSCKWAACNLGSTTPEDYGDYYAWGETETRTFFYSSNYSHYRKDIGTEISGTSYDAARKVLGSPWRMPTKSGFQELLDKCFWKEITYKNTTGYLVTGKNGNAIFLPRTGYKSDNTSRSGYGIWTSTYYYYSSSSQTTYASYWSGSTLGYIERYYGLTIRPVQD